MILAGINKIISDATIKALDVAGENPDSQFALREHGDFTSNLAFRLAKQLKQNPNDIAQRIAEAVQDKDVAAAKAVGGYVNLEMKSRYWVESLDRAKVTRVERPEKVQVEFISANPTGPLTIGNARGGYIGDVIARTLEFIGHDVTREYYFNNAGTQISNLLDSVKSAAGIEVEGEIQYKGPYIEEIASRYKRDIGSKSDEELKQLITEHIIDQYIKPAVIKMGIEFDVWFNEKDLIDDGTFAETLKRLKTKGLVFEKDGAIWLKTGGLGDDRDERVLVKSNGDPTYLGPDLAYHLNIFEKRGFERAIKVLGPDHIAQFPSVKAAIKALLPEKKLEMASHQWLRLVHGGEELKMSKRLGQYVTVMELIDEVGAEVARFFTLMRSAESHMDFDLDLAREQNQKNPYYYVMYSYARANSILTKAQEAGIEPERKEWEPSDQEREIIKLMCQWNDLLHQISHDYQVHRIIFFGQEMARLFHDYYENERIISLPGAVAQGKLYFVQRYIKFMREYWGVIGIKPIEKM